MHTYDIYAITAYLKKHLPTTRFNHTIGSRNVAEELAALHDVSQEKAAIAALLHDAGKRFSHIEMAQYVSRYRVPVPDRRLIIRHNPELLHSFISADIARRVFGVRDGDIIAAVREHTLGSIRMSSLAKIIYVSDAIAPDRRYRGIAAIRTASHRDLEHAVRLTMIKKLHHVIYSHQWLAPEALRAWNAHVSDPRNHHEHKA